MSWRVGPAMMFINIKIEGDTLSLYEVDINYWCPEEFTKKKCFCSLTLPITKLHKITQQIRVKRTAVLFSP